MRPASLRARGLVVLGLKEEEGTTAASIGWAEIAYDFENVELTM